MLLVVLLDIFTILPFLLSNYLLVKGKALFSQLPQGPTCVTLFKIVTVFLVESS